MFFRGGLLIEPWKAFKFYTNVPKEQSIVLYEVMIQAYLSESFYMELANNPSGLLATEIKNLAMSAVAENEEEQN